MRGELSLVARFFAISPFKHKRTRARARARGRASVARALERFYNGPAEETRLRKIPSTLVLRSSVKPQGEHSAFPERLP